jgi:predicted MFS family arabinose efflux permease
MTKSLSHVKSQPVQPGHVPVMSWFVLALLLAAYTSSWIDRYLLIILVQPIETDLGLSDAQMGLLTGFAFAVVYSLAAFPIGRWADNGSRRNILALATGMWSVMTVATGFVSTFFGLVFMRASVAVGQSGCSPASHSLISDYFPPQRRSVAFSIYVLGISLGIWLGLALGGMISDRYGWRAAFIVLGAPGIALALAIRFLLPEPKRGVYDGHGASNRSYSLSETLVEFRRRRAFLAAALGLALLSFSSSGLEMWTPVWLMRVRGAGAGEIGSIFGGIEGIAGMAGTLIAGFVTDRFAARDPRWYLWVVVISAVLVIPFEYLFLFTAERAGNLWMYGWLTVTVLVMSTYTAPMFAFAQFMLPPRLKAVGAATLLFALNMIGTGGGPSAVGALSNALAPLYGTAASLKYGMALTMLALVPALVCFGYAIVRLPKDLQLTTQTKSA